MHPRIDPEGGSTWMKCSDVPVKSIITTARRARMKKIVSKLIVILLFLSGLSLLLYPLVANKWNNYRQEQLITSYEETVTEQEKAGTVEYDVEMVHAHDYNEALKPYILPDSFARAASSGEADEVYMSCLNLTGDGMMGYVQIPKINVKIPIFHTTDEEILQTAAGHLEGSSLPVGGEGNHAVISAHRGLPSATLFTDLDQLAEGDCFFLYVLDDVLCYRVDQISVVEPEDTSALAAVEGKDLVTLLTCTPYGVNSHRLLVRGSRVPYEEIEDEMVATSDYKGPSLHTNYLLWVLVGLGVTGLFIAALYLYDRRTRKNRKSETALEKDAEKEKDEGSKTERSRQEEDNDQEEDKSWRWKDEDLKEEESWRWKDEDLKEDKSWRWKDEDLKEDKPWRWEDEYPEEEGSRRWEDEDPEKEKPRQGEDNDSEEEQGR